MSAICAANAGEDSHVRIKRVNQPDVTEIPSGRRSGRPVRPWGRASKLAMPGVDPLTIQELSGWRWLVMVQRYTYLTPAHKAAAVEGIASSEFPNAIPKPAARRPSRRAVKWATVKGASR